MSAALLATLLAVPLSTCAHARPARPTAAPTPMRTIVDRMGTAVDASTARHEIAFRPFAPPRRVIGLAVVPPFNGDDVRAHRGIAIEYADNADRRYALVQWPAYRRRLSGFQPLDVPEADCPGARSFSRGTRPSGIVWSTPHGLVMTLQPDGKNNAQTLQAEWRKLIRRGVCR